MAKYIDLMNPRQRLKLRALEVEGEEHKHRAILEVALTRGSVDIGDVDVLSIAAGEEHLGQVGGEGGTEVQNPTITAGAYSANDNVGGLLTFTDAARVSGDGGILNKIVIIDDAQQNAELELWLFDQTFTPGADNDAWSPSEADLENLIDVVSTTSGTWYNTENQGVCVIELARRYDLVGTSLFGRLVNRDTPIFAAADDLTVKASFLTD